MNVYQKYKDAQGRKTGPWFIKYPCGRDPLRSRTRSRRLVNSRSWLSGPTRRKLEEYLLQARNLATGSPISELAKCSIVLPSIKMGSGSYP
jgi:hypothetical protein